MAGRTVTIGWATLLPVALAACQGAGETAASPTVTITQTATVTASPSPTVVDAVPGAGTVGGEETPDADGSPFPDDLSSTSTATPESTSVSTARSGQPLGLDDAHTRLGAWEEDRYEIADRTDVSGMGVEVTRCGDSSSAPELEYRLANRFNRVTMQISQANSSQDSDHLLTILVIANGSQLDIQRVPFNQVKPLELEIGGVNALRLRFYLDEENTDACSSQSSVIAVIEDLVVT